MKLIIAISAVLLSTAAVAQQATSTLANVPTGYQVKGTTHYVLEPGAVVRQIDLAKAPPAERVRAMVDPKFTSSHGTQGLTPAGPQ